MENNVTRRERFLQSTWAPSSPRSWRSRLQHEHAGNKFLRARFCSVGYRTDDTADVVLFFWH
jgi:hypothetical protein